ncbi:MAG: hypothetical protein M1818_008252 [Claussenomyces sp. TS43310]|nr:MAG: hypothetical protein M1818_008252 [Claussenomyces sp. TS43310]
MKRKSAVLNGDANGRSTQSKKAKSTTSEDHILNCFRKGLFDASVLKQYVKDHAESEPYKHAVIKSLMDDSLLRAVRNEIRDNVQFTPKETDIYKIHQSGDLANLDGLEDEALAKLPSLLKLRDALYSPEFRKYAATITGSGELSGRKTDMAINVYTPGCHLLCHDDVIGSRRISYILYLTDPDIPWKKEWGGALRLFPTDSHTGDDGEETKTPTPDFSKVIPPAWNQLSFFTVQPGESFHDVEEVYHASSKEELEKDGGRVRMAISGWFHIPQLGEEGYIEGEEERLAKKSSLMQLQGKADQYDFPREDLIILGQNEVTPYGSEFEAADIEFLLKYMAPGYLTPDTMEQVADHFEEISSVTLDGLLSPKFATKVREYVEIQEKSATPASNHDSEKEASTQWHVARPPHKHRFLYNQPKSSSGSGSSKDTKETPVWLSPIEELINVFLPSPQFRKWLQIATSCDIESQNIMARRFRRGVDYALATSYEGDPKLEVSLGLTPTTGWGDDEGEEDKAADEQGPEGDSSEKDQAGAPVNGHGKAVEKKIKVEEDIEEDDVGGYESYLASDESPDDDAATYKMTGNDDDNVLFTMTAAWNKMSIVLRDSGTLKFVKYVSQNAKGDRWDVAATYGVKESEILDDDVEKAGANENGDAAETSAGSTQVSLESSGDEEEFAGFPDTDDSDSD